MHIMLLGLFSKKTLLIVILNTKILFFNTWNSVVTNDKITIGSICKLCNTYGGERIKQNLRFKDSGFEGAIPPTTTSSTNLREKWMKFKYNRFLSLGISKSDKVFTAHYPNSQCIVTIFSRSTSFEKSYEIKMVAGVKPNLAFNIFGML